MLHELQQRFRAAVLGADDAPLDSLVRSPRGAAAGRIAVYRNTVQASLTDVLAAAFPVTQRIMGANNFTRAARRFIAAHPPRRPHLSAYGDEFPAFLGGLEVLRPLPYLPDVARLEWARGEAYFAADADPLDPARLAAVAPVALPNVVLEMHPAARLVLSPFPIHRIWTVNQPDMSDVPAIDMTVAEAALVTRPESAVIMRRLGGGDGAFISAIAAGAALGEAAECALQVESDFDLQAALHDHFINGTFGGFRAP